ncbi:MAG: hypothetical protein LBB48_00555 [Treponema sp.]|jgi:hypothetical protein|nr:hypothetical protein [Treponema sp.]
MKGHEIIPQPDGAFLEWNPAVSNVERKTPGIPAPKTRPEFGFKVLDLMRI